MFTKSSGDQIKHELTIDFEVYIGNKPKTVKYDVTDQFKGSDRFHIEIDIEDITLPDSGSGGVDIGDWEGNEDIVIGI